MNARFRWLYPFDYAVIVYLLFAVYLTRHLEIQFNWSVFLDFRYELLMLFHGTPVVLSVVYAHQIFVKRKSLSDILGEFLRAIRTTAADWKSWHEFLRTLVALKICMTVYCHLKQEIPLLNSTIYDQELAAIDQAVHLGYDPVAESLALAGSIWFVRLVDLAYICWFLFKAPVLLFFLFQPRYQIRWQFFTSFLLVWMIGGTFAIWFPSLGPIYVEPHLFEQISAPFAQEVQAGLWDHYQQLQANPEKYRIQIYEGIAAFPSLHVAIVALYAVALRKFGWVFWPALAYCCVMQFGSVLLGWHYAIDGYFGAVMAVAIYFALSPISSSAKPRSNGSSAIANHHG